jgi:hypothetical protein
VKTQENGVNVRARKSPLFEAMPISSRRRCYDSKRHSAPSSDVAEQFTRLPE